LNMINRARAKFVSAVFQSEFKTRTINLVINIMKSNLIIFFLSAIWFQASEAIDTCPKSFDAAVRQTFTSLDNRDLASYMNTISADQDQLMILPDGSTWSTREEIEQGHQEWFKDATWLFKRELIRKDVQQTWGVAVYSVSVDRPESPGKPFLLSMLFAPDVDGCWYLRHDQNTLLSLDEAE
jgi:hypothetical protein